MAGQIVHLETPADDTQAARAFYGRLFGWTFNDVPGPSEYHMTQLGEQQGAAITDMQPGKRGTRPYFLVDDIDDGVARVNDLGGEANQAQPIPGMGWFATCTDPHGNEFGLWQNDASAPGP